MASPSYSTHRGHADFFTGGGTPNQKRRALISTIVPGFLYLGAAQSASNLAEIERHCITRYLCCAEEVATPRHLRHRSFVGSSDPLTAEGDDVANLTSEGVEAEPEIPLGSHRHGHAPLASFMRIPLRDKVETELQEYFSEAFRFLRAAKRGNHRVLVFCQQGKSRSASVVIAYLIRYHRMSYESALERVRSCRAEVDPNVAFCMQLSRMEGRVGSALLSPPTALLSAPLARLVIPDGHDIEPQGEGRSLTPSKGSGEPPTVDANPAILAPGVAGHGRPAYGAQSIQLSNDNATPKMLGRAREERTLASVKTPPNQSIAPAALRSPPPALSILHESCSPRALALAAGMDSLSPSAGDPLGEDCAAFTSTVNSLLSTRCDSAVLPLRLPMMPRQRASPGNGMIAVGHASFGSQSPLRATLENPSDLEEDDDDDDEEDGDPLINPSFNETILVDLALGATVDTFGPEILLRDDDVVMLPTAGGSP